MQPNTCSERGPEGRPSLTPLDPCRLDCRNAAQRHSWQMDRRRKLLVASEELTKHIVAAGRTRSWERAVALLVTSSSPNRFHFNAAITACARGHASCVALHLFERLRSRVNRDVVTCGAAITTQVPAGRWQHAAWLLGTLHQQSLRSNIIVWSAAISACEKGQQWQRVVHCLQKAGESTLQPDVVSFNSAISACEKGAQWSAAQALLASMVFRRVHPDTVTYSAAISAFGAGSKWQCAVEVFRRRVTVRCNLMSSASVQLSALAKKVPSGARLKRCWRAWSSGACTPTP